MKVTKSALIFQSSLNINQLNFIGAQVCGAFD